LQVGIGEQRSTQGKLRVNLSKQVAANIWQRGPADITLFVVAHQAAGSPADLVVVGAGIVGLAHAVEAHARGLSVLVVERDARAVGASVRNFGHIGTTLHGGTAAAYAEATRDRWLSLAPKAGFELLETGTVVLARSAAELAVVEEFAAAHPGSARLLGSGQVRDQFPLATADVAGGAQLPRDLRVDPREAIPALAGWLESEGVRFAWNTNVGSVEEGVVRTSRGDFRGVRTVCACGHNVDRLFPGIAEQYGVRRCLLQMLEVAPPADARIGPAVLTGTGMLRYSAFAAMPSAAAVRAEMQQRQPELLEAGVNLMLTQRPDGSLVLGDTHHYDRTHQPFDDEDIAGLLLSEGARLLGAPLTVRRRWRGIYAQSPATDFLIAEPCPGTRVVAVTSGIGMTTALGLAAAVLDEIR
jgi:D-hydroxyproline dehydrogenase subunit beta